MRLAADPYTFCDHVVGGVFNDAGEADEVHAVGEHPFQLPGDGHGESGFADAARPGEHDDPRLGDATHQPWDLVGTPAKARVPRGQSTGGSP